MKHWVPIVLVFTLGACNSNQPNPQPPTALPPPSNNATDPHTAAAGYNGPAIKVALLQLQTHPPQNVVSINLTAPTGGWSLKRDKAEVSDGTAKVYLTLLQPGQGEMTTQALVEHQANFTTTESFDWAEIYINFKKRSDARAAADYRLARRLATADTDDLFGDGAGNQSPPSDHVPGASDSNSGHAGETSIDHYTGPPVLLQVVQAKRLPPISTATIDLTAPTGGWTLNLDRAEVVGDTAMIYLTLEKPGIDEWVTQALVKLQAEYTSEKPPFAQAKVFIHQAQRDIQTLTTNYRLAAASQP